MEPDMPSEPSVADNGQLCGVINNAEHEENPPEDTQTFFIPPLLSLPSELLYEIFSYVSALDLTSLSATCQFLREHANSELLWAALVDSNVHTRLHDPSPFESFRSLYVAYHPFWFLVRNKIWFSDVKNTGKLILVRYNAPRGRIEGYRIVARHSIRFVQAWSKNPSVIVSSFDPVVSLWLDDPVILLEKELALGWGSDSHGRRSEVRMPMDLEAQRVFSSFIFCDKTETREDEDESRMVWPPSTIPADERVNVAYSDIETFAFRDKPLRLKEVSEAGFRLRRWIQFGGNMSTFEVGTVMDGVSTFGTLRPDLYTPTKDKPYQGIWIGDYSGHGSEYLLILQQDYDPASTGHSAAGATVENAASSSQATSSQNVEPGNVPYRGLKAIKLTGDPNVPRGEITFKADDIGPNGTIRIADEEMFRGARVVNSWGHIAATNFARDTYIPSQIILISNDCIAHYWTELGHISYYRRIDIDQLLNQ
ncbi:F-box domain containing protein [Coccidioides immitis RMSCC 2394]|uniref:F-box domain containing protein n=1 Tax=Coccidioides immitis RMSCC 2394 TaxID=404692 RepID=A0A0J6YCF9_COCIT|nr:F-box domain containing protein [Coccidioides immitis RMSCC 2394]